MSFAEAEDALRRITFTANLSNILTLFPCYLTNFDTLLICFFCDVFIVTRPYLATGGLFDVVAGLLKRFTFTSLSVELVCCFELSTCVIKMCL